VDEALARAARSGEPVAVAVIEAEGLRGSGLEVGAVHRARRTVTDALRRGVRRTDPVGELSLCAWLVGLPGCEKGVARRRVDQVLGDAAARLSADPELRGLTLEVGVADSHGGASTLAHRAERDLRRR
jgi:hypothetical protein